MAVQKILQIGDPKLKAENKPVADLNDTIVKQIITDLKDTMRENGLIGLAAPQIGANYRIFVTEPRETKYRTAYQTDKLRIYINPKIISESEETSVMYEGCGCVQDIFGPVQRPQQIIVSATNSKGHLFQLNCDGLLARVIQHEYDHLQSIEYIERVTDYSKLMHVTHYIEKIKNSPKQKAASKITTKEFKYLELPPMNPTEDSLIKG